MKYWLPLLAALLLSPTFAAQGILPRTGEVLFSSKISRGNIGDQFGRSVDKIGDLDDDGVIDLVVGASHDDDLALNSGSVWILFMNPDMTVKAQQKISQALGGFTATLGEDNVFGKEVSALGDLDGDGVEDIVVGAPSDGTASDRAIYILFLNTDGTVRDWEAIFNTSSEFGRSIANMGDLDGDGVTDLCVGNGYGRTWIYYLNSDGTAKSFQTYNNRLNSTPGFDTFYGLGMEPIGDWDGDGIMDLAIGDTAADFGGVTDSGAMYISLVSAGGTDKQEIPIYDGLPGLTVGLPGYPNFGRDAALLSDMDGNGVPDLAISCSEYWSGNEPEDSGAVFITFLEQDGTVIDHEQISRLQGNLGQNIQAFNEFGISMAPLGDVNGDGTIDLAVGARFDGSGALYILRINDGSLEFPDVAAMATPRDGPLPLDVQFTDLSTGTVTEWLWDFGDGNTSTEQNPIHTYRTEGVFSVTLTVSGPGMMSDSMFFSNVITIDPAVASFAEFTVDPEAGLVPLSVDFTDTSLGDVTSWSWDFGDGNTSTQQNPTHTYTATGSYTPTLSVDGPTGPDSYALPAPIEVFTAVAPTASFSSSTNAGIVPLTVNFTDTSTPFADSWSWDFGDGNTSTQQNPTHVYTTPGLYTVSLTAGNAAGSDTQTQVDAIDAFLPPLPLANFGADVMSGSTPLTVSFSDLSTGPVDSWLWDFGNGFTSTVQNPSHTYSSGGDFDVSLTVTNLSGSDTWTVQSAIATTQTIDVTPFDDGINGNDGATGSGWIMYTQEAVESRFSASPPNFGNVSDHLIAVIYSSNQWFYDNNSNYVVFTPRSSDRLVASVDFGADTASMLVGSLGTVNGIASGYTSGDLNIVPNLWDGGTNNGEFGATGSFITIGGGISAPKPSFTASPTSGTSPLLVSFTDTTTGGATSWSWDFGDGNTSTLQNPTNNYLGVGTYTVTLTATGPGGSNARTFPNLITVSDPAPVADFSADATSGPAPFDVQFTDLSTQTPTSWSWDFGDGNTSTQQNPSHTYAAQGTYAVSLTAMNASGSDTLTRTDYIVALPPAPTAGFSADLTSGPAPLTVNFTDLSTDLPTSWSWDFGDGNTSTLQNPTHVYMLEGTYTVSLTATNASGSDTHTVASLIQVLPPAPTANFSASTTSGPAPLFVQFTDLSTDLPTAWSWDFGDGNSSTLQSPGHTYTAEGSYTVSLTASNASGSDTLVGATITVTVPAPVASFTADTTSGPAPLDVQFTDTSTGSPTSWSWDFGDGNSSTLQNPSHTYTAAGNYTVTLTATNAGGSDGFTLGSTIDVDPPAPTASFTADVTSGPAPLDVQFTDTSTDAPTNWSWDFGDGNSSTLQNPAHTYSSSGSFTVTLTATNASGSDSFTLGSTIDVDPPAPVASFTADVTSGPAPLDVQFTDTSTNSPTSWSWDFGDGNSSTLQNPSHTYLAEGSYTVSLTATNASGSDSFTLGSTIDVDPPAPVASFTADVTSGPAPLDVQFTDTSTDLPTSWSWDFGDGNTSTLQNPAHTYTAEGSYTVSLTATNASGSDTFTLGSTIDVDPPAPTASFTADVTSGPAPLDVQFTDTSTDAPTSWSWDFGDGNTSTLQNPSHTYLAEGSYTVSLTATNASGSDTFTLGSTIDVDPPAPTASFTADVTSGPVPLDVQFTDTSTDLPTSWSWDFGDGNSSTLQNPAHTYTTVGNFTVTLTATNASGSDSFTLGSTIDVGDPPPTASFTVDATSGPAPLTVQFTDTSVGPPTGWSWDFGDGNTSTQQSPSHTFTAAGSYTVSLTATNASGSDTFFLGSTIEVAPPLPVANFVADRLIGALPLAVQFTDLSTQSPTSWSWDFGDGATSTLQNPSHTYTTAGQYTVTLDVVGPTGADSLTRVDYVWAGIVVGIGGGGFEASATGDPPLTPWVVDLGTEHRVRPGPASSDLGMPTEGTQWLELSAEGSVASLPPTSPGGITSPSQGGAGVYQTFFLPENEFLIKFDASFLLAGNLQDAAFNDWMSVDISDGTTTANLFYRDSFSAFERTSEVHGLPMTKIERVVADIEDLFPTATSETAFTLYAYVGNGGDGLTSSRGYVDFIRCEAGSSLEIYGCGVNPAGSMAVSGSATLGSQVLFDMDNPLGTQCVGTTTVNLYITTEPDPLYPCGSLRPGFGMAGSSGENLVDWGTPGHRFRRIRAPAWAGAGMPTRVSLRIPNIPSLIGMDFYAQGLFVDSNPSCGTQFGLTEAVRIVVGP